MDVCGTVYVTKDVLSFALKCAYCTLDIKEWQDFLLHIKNHLTLKEEPEETWADSIVISKMGIFIEEMKPIVDDANCMLRDDGENVLDKDSEKCSILEEPIVVLNNDRNVKNAKSKRRNAFVDSDTEAENDCSTFEPDSQDESDDSSDTEGDMIDTENAEKSTSFKFEPNFNKRCALTKSFIGLYHNATCLWDSSHENYKNFSQRTEALKEMLAGLRTKFNIVTTEHRLKTAISKLRKEYAETLRRSSINQKMPAIAMEYLNACIFLRDIEDCSAEFNDSVRCVSFLKINNLTTTFIDAYASRSVLYDSQHKDYTNGTVRKQNYEDMAKEIKNKTDAVFNEEDINKGIEAVRHWYRKAQLRAQRNDASNSPTDVQQFYLKKCKFVPLKAVKIKLTCELCGKIAYNELKMQEHKYNAHKIGDMAYKCTNCERQFEKRSQLQQHEKRQHIGKVHQCGHCERRFAIYADMQRHMATHTDERPFVCEMCGKAFRSKIQLGYHTDRHTSNRQFKCNMCPKDFLKKGDLRDHIKAHLNIRDKICNICGKGFTNCHSLYRHRQIHSEVKKFACTLCDAKFHQFVGLNSHMKRTHNIVKKKQETVAKMDVDP